MGVNDASGGVSDVSGGDAGPPGTVLAIDAGNSKTDVAVIGPDGSVLGTARGGGFQPPVVGPEQAVAALAPLIDGALRQADPEAAARPTHLSACLANADLPSEEAHLTELITSRGWSKTVSVVNDTFAVLRSGLPDDAPEDAPDDGSERTGVAVVCGAGINCAGLGPGGRTARFPAIGRISGDWGGGAHLAEEALWWAARADDGRGAPTALATELPAHFGLSAMPELIEALHLGRIPPARRHELTPVLFSVATAGDDVARALIARQAEEIALLATVALRRLGLLTSPTPVILGGSVLAARHPLLHEGVTTQLSRHAPKALPHTVTTPPVLGAALLALDHTPAPTSAYRRLRSQY